MYYPKQRTPKMYLVEIETVVHNSEVPIIFVVPLESIALMITKHEPLNYNVLIQGQSYLISKEMYDSLKAKLIVNSKYYGIE